VKYRRTSATKSGLAKVAVRFSKERFSISENSYFKGALSKAVGTFGKPKNVGCNYSEPLKS